ncbi:NAD dependent epimerase/dehydratase [Hirsutella rhossiliensis]|uniref:NAD dependent epimerase/dehydratase n=1 Tax=Hirsutella rhossiliensis TaxID=111463 RepID=A0A9P8N9I0_9HYPO|nr:NAD dependent epimerase/dehydratase [Hirsutella rhossiliensis]KAH0968471.1 NAD dependent epimerase/dehydratase [Hirsutella rhossiliensis]
MPCPLYRRKPLTDIFTSESDINRRTCSRNVPMRVLILGMGRTGTASMRIAMKQLGYHDTYHMMSCSIENPPDALMWMEALRAKYDGQGKPFGPKEWDRLLGHAQAVCDWPSIAFAKELIEAYPEAKVILTNRNVDSWHASTMKTVYWRVTDPELRWLSHFDWAASMYYPMLKKFFDTFFEGDFPSRGKEIFQRHYDEVRGLVVRDHLLEYDVAQGWEPLCKFLGHPVPEFCPFPHVNDSSDFLTRSQRRNRNQMYNVALRYFLWLVMATMAILVMSRLSIVY